MAQMWKPKPNKLNQKQKFFIDDGRSIVQRTHTHTPITGHRKLTDDVITIWENHHLIEHLTSENSFVCHKMKKTSFRLGVIEFEFEIDLRAADQTKIAWIRISIWHWPLPAGIFRVLFQFCFVWRCAGRPNAWPRGAHNTHRAHGLLWHWQRLHNECLVSHILRAIGCYSSVVLDVCCCVEINFLSLYSFIFFFHFIFGLSIFVDAGLCHSRMHAKNANAATSEAEAIEGKKSNWNRKIPSIVVVKRRYDRAASTPCTECE